MIMNAQTEDQNTAESAAYNPFPEPQTIPSGWDLSEIFFDPCPASDAGTKDFVKNESD
jgi:hypothetical protein